MTSAEATAPNLAETLVDAWGSWGPTLSPDCRRVAYVSDRSGTPRIWVQDLPAAGTPPPAAMITLSDDPAVAVSWSADGSWLACILATDGGVRTQVWAVRPDGRDARLVAGGPDQHAELGPWTRSGHRVVVTIPGAGLAEDAIAYLVDPVDGELTPLAR
jgi:Tol biopolymer transport system component